MANILVTSLIIAGALLSSVTPASAALSKEFAIGVYGDQRVLSALGATDGSPVGIAPYVADGGPAVNTQRWRFEFESTQPYTPPRHLYRIKHVKTGLCLGKTGTGGPQAQLRACTASTLWYTAKPTYGGGFWLRHNDNTRCLDGMYSGTEAGLNSCYNLPTGGRPGEHWILRTGPFECVAEGTVLCVRPEQPVYGLMSTWHQHVITYSGTTYSNMLNSLEWSTLDAQGNNSRGEGFKFGWESRYSAEPRVESAYWVEYDSGSYNYYSLASKPGGAGADGRLHTYMVVPGEGSQLALYFDFNPVGSTTKAESARIGESSGGLFAETIEAATFAGPFAHRMRLLDANDVWRRPWVTETSTRETYPCDAPRNAPATGGPNTPPRCLTASTVAKAGSSPAAIDYFEISKPSTSSLQNPLFIKPSTEASQVYNGVDQRALAACMAEDATRCMSEVRGLAACVKALRACNVNAERSSPLSSTARAAITEQQALRLADEALSLVPGSPATTAKARTISAQDFARVAGSAAFGENKEDVIVVAGDGPVQSLLGRRVKEYNGYKLAFGSRTGKLLHACLGADCSDGT
ncbi:RICIN domain-containing protein [Micromonospora sp. NPDC047812]|uniref:RICIN domain-containing protein n=1 Tax=Micromonospora sp. NPDC047812 TaxID=3155742 RepID=UPI0034537E6F